MEFNLLTRKRMRFNMQVIWQSLYWYFNFSLSLRDVSQMLAERGIEVHHSSVFRWISKFTSELEKMFRKHKLPVNTSWRVDETYIKIKGKDRYLYRAVDTRGNTIDFLLTHRRNFKAATRFFNKLIKSSGLPSKVNTDKSGANRAALDSVNESNRNRIKTSDGKYLNNMVEQDHRFIKKRIRPMLGFKTFKSARVILAGIEMLRMIAKGQCGFAPLFHRTLSDTFWILVKSIRNSVSKAT